jgi:hypothetical protein
VPHFQPIDNSYHFNIEADAKEMIVAAKFREKINLWLAICPLFKEYLKIKQLSQIVIIIFRGGGGYRTKVNTGLNFRLRCLKLNCET